MTVSFTCDQNHQASSELLSVFRRWQAQIKHLRSIERTASEEEYKTAHEVECGLLRVIAAIPASCLTDMAIKYYLGLQLHYTDDQIFGLPTSLDCKALDTMLDRSLLGDFLPLLLPILKGGEVSSLDENGLSATAKSEAAMLEVRDPLKEYAA